LTTAALLLKGPLRKADGYLASLEAAHAKALDTIEKKRTERSSKEVALEGELNTIKVKEQSATQALAAATTTIQQLQAKISELDEGRNLVKFLLERFQADDYRRHLGLVSTIRRDFRKLSELLKSCSAVTGKPPIDRIILYVDDLDRCPPTRVGEVLEAVHLLLAFDLFVVVVGVDPRWMLRSLQEIHPAFQDVPSNRLPANEGWRSTPQDYLEKIFQIPFALRPMTEHGFGSLVRSLLPETKADTRPDVVEAAPPPKAPTSSTTLASGGIGTSQDSTGTKAPPPMERPNTAGSQGAQTRRLNPGSLAVRAWEQDFAERLYELIPTPRAAKRFTNIYRLLKAPVATSALPAFEGTAEQPGEYRIAMLLLALQAGFPEVAERLFARATSPGSKYETPSALIEDLETLALGADLEGRLRRAILPILEEGLHMQTKDYLRWIAKIARFSFVRTRAIPRLAPGRS